VHHLVTVSGSRGKDNEDLPSDWHLYGVGKCSDSLPNKIRVNQTQSSFGGLVLANTNSGRFLSSSLSNAAFESLSYGTNKQDYPFDLNRSSDLSGLAYPRVALNKVRVWKLQVLACVVVVSC